MALVQPMVDVLPPVVRDHMIDGGLSDSCKDGRFSTPSSARVAAELVAAAARQKMPEPQRASYHEERRGSEHSLPSWTSEQSVNLEELVRELGVVGPCTVLDFIIERVDERMPVGMDVVHGKNKLIVKSIHDVSLVTKFESPEEAYKSIMPGDVILSVNGQQRDASLMIDAFRESSMVGDANVYLLVARFPDQTRNPYLLEEPAVELRAVRHGESGTVDDDEDHMIVARSVGGTCRLVAKYLCKPLRIVV
mmetsp:Transcript_11116/g.25187  ORF Transcript_11116/g.25187 Transcript_11116/m.25187 type:complete len:250 (+) Transcript_11116:47-796(+)